MEDFDGSLQLVLDLGTGEQFRQLDRFHVRDDIFAKFAAGQTLVVDPKDSCFQAAGAKFAIAAEGASDDDFGTLVINPQLFEHGSDGSFDETSSAQGAPKMPLTNLVIIARKHV